MREEEFYTTEETMGLLKVSRITLYRWIKSGRLPATKLGNTYRFSKDDVERYRLGEPVVAGTTRIAAPSRTPLDITARGIAEWSSNGNKAAQALLPELIRRLIEESNNDAALTNIHIPVGDQTGQAGFDGYVVAAHQTRYVPSGASVWEMGVGEPSKKAQSDYRKRTSKTLGVDPNNTTFVFVTPQNWANGNDWVMRRKQELDYSWKDLRVLDATDLEAWIEQSPVTKAWFMKRLQLPDHDIFDIESYWNRWARATNPTIKPELLLVGRENQKEELLKRIKDRTASFITIAANTDAESRAFIGAVIATLDDDDYSEYASSFLVIEDKQAWDAVVASAPNPLILIPAFTGMDEYSSATNKGHMVINGVDKSALTPENNSIVLNAPRRREIQTVLEEMGIAENEAHKLALIGRSSMKSLWRKLAIAPASNKPTWAAQYKTLIPAMLAGQWDETVDGDKKALSLLAGKDYGSFISDLHDIARGPESPVVHVDSFWYAISKDDLWNVLADHIKSNELDAFVNIAVDILSEDDPKYDLPVKERWAAAIYNKKREYSGRLRESIADTVAFVATWPPEIKISGHSGQDIANSVAKRVFDAAKFDTTGRIWASLSDVARFLAEASPEKFLNALESDLKDSPEKLRFLFQDSKKHSSMMGSSSPHTGILWALEATAWLPEYLPTSVSCLALLHQLDIEDGSISNRPLASIKDIFLTWHPQTMASVDDRMIVLKGLTDRYPATAWQILVELLPKSHEFTTGNYKPKWRQWASEDRSVTYADIHAVVHEITKMIFGIVGNDIDKLTVLIKHIEALPPSGKEELANRLEKIDVLSLAQGQHLALWEALKEVIYRHRKYTEQSWAMPAQQLDIFNAALANLEPKNPVDQAISLFRYRVELPDDEEDYEKYDLRVAHARKKIVQKIYTQQGVEAIIELSSRVDAPHFIGSPLAKMELPNQEEEKLFMQLTAKSNDKRSDLVRSYVGAKANSLGLEWAKSAIAASQALHNEEKLGVFLSALPTTEQVWRIVDKTSSPAQKHYWLLCNQYIEDDGNYQRLVSELANVGRGYNAIEVLSHHIRRAKQKPSVSLVLEAIESFLRSLGDSDEPYDATMFRYHLKHLTSHLYEHISENDEERLTQLEWPLLYIMGNQANPRLLQKRLTTKPEFFIDVLKHVYLPHGSKRQKLTKQQQQDARLGSELLDNWSLIPGDNGSHIDQAILTAWIDKVTPLLKDENRLEVGLRTIGKLFGRSRKDPDDEAWPAKAVREAIEHIANEELNEGIRMAVYNGRGVTSRSVGEGGDQERILADKYFTYAEKMGVRYPHTRKLLNSIATMWSREAERHDNDALKEDV